MSQPEEATPAPLPALPASGPQTAESVTIKTTQPSMDPEYQKRFEEYRTGVEKILTDMHQTLEERQKRSLDLTGQYQTLLENFRKGSPQEEPPQPVPIPPTPSRAIRPFLEGGPGESGTQLLQRVTLGLGTLAQMATGLMLKYPEGALAAWNGALQGWAEGDAIRGDREFERWQAEVKAGRAAYADRLSRWRALRDKYKDNEERLKTEMAIMFAREGAAKDYIESALKTPQLIWEKLDKEMAVWDKMMTHSSTAELKRMLQKSQDDWKRFQSQMSLIRLQDQRSDREFRHKIQSQMLDLFRQRTDVATNQKYGMPMMDMSIAWKELDAIEDALKNLDAKGKLPKTPLLVDQWLTSLERDVTARGDPDMMYLYSALAPVFIGRVDRSLRDDKGVRAAMIFADQLKVLHSLGPLDSMLKITGQVRDQLRVKSAGLLEQARALHMNPELLAIMESYNDSMMSSQDRDIERDLDEATR